MSASERIAREVESWDGVETGPGRFGSVRFTVDGESSATCTATGLPTSPCAPRSPGS